jgi:hypothetical protein
MSCFEVVLKLESSLVFFMHGDVNQLLHLKDLLLSFVETSGLKVNFDKSFMVPINVSDDKM